MVAWYDIAPGAAAEHDDWHSHEHMPERLGIPGFLRGRRGVALSGSPHYFVMYEVAQLATLTAPPYLERLNDPTPWSRNVMSHFRNMTRSLCRVQGSFGAGLGQTVVTIRLSPAANEADALRRWLRDSVLPGLAARAGVVGAHLLETEPPAGLPQTEEQRLRGGDAAADWVVLVEGYDSDAVLAVVEHELRRPVLMQHGAGPAHASAAYRLAFVLTDRESGRSR